MFLTSNTSLINDFSKDSIPHISFWDLRYQKISTPFLSLDVPPTVGRILSLGISRDGNRLFAAGAKKHILEYFLCGETHPVKAYNYNHQNSYRSQIRMSPFSDHFLIGNRDEGGLLYDFQYQDNHPMRGLNSDDPIVIDNIYPKYEYPGKVVTDEVNNSWGLDWSVNGKYIIMVGLDSMTFYTNELPKSVEFMDDSQRQVLIDGIPNVLSRPNRTKEYYEQVIHPKKNGMFGLDDMDDITDLVGSLEQRPRKR